MKTMKTCFIADAKWSTPGDLAVADVSMAMMMQYGWMTVSMAEQAGCIILGGGGSLYERQEHLIRDRQSMRYSQNMDIISRGLDNGAKFYVLGAGCQGFMCDQQAKDIWEQLLHKAELISFRDSGSINWLCEDLNFSPNKPQIKVHGDLAFYLDLGSNRTHYNSKLVTVAVSPSTISAEDTQSLIQCLNELVAMDYEICWFPFVEEDIQLHGQCAQQVKSQVVVSEFHGKYCPNYFRYLHQSRMSALTISNRLHGMVFGIMARRPMVVINSARKMKMQIEHLFPSGFRWQVGGNFEADHMVEKIKIAMENEEAIISEFDNVARVQRSRIDECAKEFNDLACVSSVSP